MNNKKVRNTYRGRVVLKKEDNFRAHLVLFASIDFVEMGCFGLGVTRILAAIVETSHDQDGIIWPSAVAPYKVFIWTKCTFPPL